MKANICCCLLLACLVFPAHGWQEIANDEIAQGQRLFREGRTNEAYDLLQRALFRDPDNPANSSAYHTLARIFLDRNQPDRALAILSRVPERDRTLQTRILRGHGLLRGGYLDQGISVLNQISPDKVSLEERPLYFEALAEGKARKQKPLEALYLYHTAFSHATADHDAVRILGAVSRTGLEIADTPWLKEAHFMFQETATGHVLALLAAGKLYQGGNGGEALELLRPILESRIDFPSRQEAAELYQRITGASWEQQHTIGVLLPLSGSYASFGKMVQRGMELALESWRQEGKGGVRFLFRDTASDPDRTATVVRDLIFREQATALLGPLSGAATETAAHLAQQERVPLLTLSPRAGIPDIGPFVFRVSLTAEAQVRTLVRYAIEEQGLTRFAILYPTDPIGNEFAELFSRLVTETGGKLVASQAYRPDATDFREPILRLLGRNPSGPLPSSRSENMKRIHSALPFQALFIPDYGERVGLLASHLPYYDVKGAQLLGINSWQTPELVSRGGGALEGAVFTDGFFSDSPHPEIRTFVQRFQERFSESPSILDAQGYDAALLYLRLLEDPQLRTREAFQRAIINLSEFPGLTGTLTFRENGDAEKTLFLLRIRNGAVEQLN